MDTTQKLATLNGLRADLNASLVAFRARDDIGSGAWHAARMASAAISGQCRALEVDLGAGALTAEQEIAVFGGLRRRHSDPVRTTWSMLHPQR